MAGRGAAEGLDSEIRDILAVATAGLAEEAAERGRREGFRAAAAERERDRHVEESSRRESRAEAIRLRLAGERAAQLAVGWHVWLPSPGDPEYSQPYTRAPVAAAEQRAYLEWVARDTGKRAREAGIPCNVQVSAAYCDDGVILPEPIVRGWAIAERTHRVTYAPDSSREAFVLGRLCVTEDGRLVATIQPPEFRETDGRPIDTVCVAETFGNMAKPIVASSRRTLSEDQFNELVWALPTGFVAGRHPSRGYARYWGVELKWLARHFLKSRKPHIADSGPIR